MAQADESAWPVGFSCHIEFDFADAVENIRNQLTPEFIEDGWVATLRTVFKECHAELTDINEDVTYLFVQITFLDMLWERVFGRVKGPSPWKSIRDGLDTEVVYDGDDYYEDYDDILSASSEDETTDEEVLDFLRDGFWVDDDTCKSRVTLESPEEMDQFFQRGAA